MADNRRFRYAMDRAHGRPAKRPKTLRCRWCKKKIAVQPRGRLPDYCSHSCRQRAYERAKWQQPHLVALRKDLLRVAVNTEIRRAVSEATDRILREAGLEEYAAPPKKPRPVLRVVRDDDAPPDA